MEKEFFQKLRDIPLSEYAPVPFWSWNNRIEIEEAKRQIRQMKEVGYGGFIIHARAGLKTTYLSEEWFACVDACVREAKKYNMCVWIYDEFGYPSGFVGGKLLDEQNNRAQYLEYEVKQIYDENAFAVFVEENGVYRRIMQNEPARKYHTIYRKYSPCNTDILNPSVVQKFIKETHEEYYARFGAEFGKTIRGFFTDEPQYYRYATPYAPSLEREFSEKYGENVKDGLIYLFLSDEESYPFRVKYYQAMNRLYTQTFYKALYDWCEAHGCQLTGHTVEEPHLYSQMWGCAGAMPSYEYSHMPGIDHLCRKMDGVMDLVQVESMASQFAKKLVMSESFACTGLDADFRLLKYIGDYQYTNGVNYLVVHLMNYSIQGSGIKDHPQTFSAHAPWWQDFSLLNKYFTRLGYIFANTKREVRVLLVHPIQDCYLTYDRNADEISVKEVEERFYTLSKQLAEQGVAFHYADESILEKCGRVCEDKILIGEREYDYVVLPYRKSINAYTHTLLSKYVSGNGKLCVLGEYPPYIQGEKKEYSPLRGNIGMEDVLSLTDENVKRLANAALFERRCKSELGEFIFLLNCDEKETTTVKIEKDYFLVDLLAEDILPVGETVALEPRQSILLKKCGGRERTTLQTANMQTKDITERFHITNTSENTLLIDFAEYSFDGLEYIKQKHTEEILDILIRKKYQGKLYLKYHFNVIDKPPKLHLLAQNSRVEAIIMNGNKVKTEKTDYDPCFYVADLSEYCLIGKNEIVFRIDFYEDPSVHYAIYGEDVTESLMNMLSYDTVIEPIFLQGEFTLNNEYAIVKKSLPSRIDCIEQYGFPFFCGEITLEGEADISGGFKYLRLHGEYMAADVYVNGKKQQTDALEDKIRFNGGISDGNACIRIILKSSLRNMYGPHHYETDREAGVGPFMFTFFKQWQDGVPDKFTTEYKVVPFGLNKIEILY